MSNGVTIKPGQVGILELTGTLVYVEDVQPTFAAVVAFPEQPPECADDRVFTPGRCGIKKISPYSKLGKQFDPAELSPRNQQFIGPFSPEDSQPRYQKLRLDHGINYVDRTPEELAALAAAEAPKPDKAAAKEAKRAEKEAARQAKRAAKAAKSAPRYLQRCTQCNEQPAHPNHGTNDGQHEFQAPPLPDTGAVAPSEKPARASRTPRSKTALSSGPFVFIRDDKVLASLAAGNPKYKEGNSGRAIVDFLAEAGDDGATVDQVVAELAQHPKWNSVPRERIEFALKQLVDAGLVKA